MRNTLRSYDTDPFQQVLARMEGQRSPRLVTLDPNYVTQSIGADGTVQKLFRPGYFAGSIPGSTKARILPRTKVAGSGIASSGMSLPVVDAQIFIPGDVISTIAASGSITIGPASGSTWVAGDIATAVVAGVSVSYTVLSGDVTGTDAQTNQAIATGLLANLVADYRLATKISGIAVAGVATLFSRDLTTLYSLTVSKTSTNGTITASGATFTAGGVTVGTVSAVDPVNQALTISAAAVAVAAGIPVGVASSSPAGLGMIQPTQPIDMLRDLDNNVALFTSASVYGQRLPYWDGQLAALFPEITFASLVGGY